MGKRILIISYFFAPQNAMGAVRPTKLAKYLSRMGHEVTVLCGPGMNDRRDPTLARDPPQQRSRPRLPRAGERSTPPGTRPTAGCAGRRTAASAAAPWPRWTG